MRLIIKRMFFAYKLIIYATAENSTDSLPVIANVMLPFPSLRASETSAAISAMRKM